MAACVQIIRAAAAEAASTQGGHRPLPPPPPLQAPTRIRQRQHRCVDACASRAAVRLQHLDVHVDLAARQQLQHDRLFQSVLDDKRQLGGAAVHLASPPPLACHDMNKSRALGPAPSERCACPGAVGLQ
jgi:hypothetical protein